MTPAILLPMDPVSNSFSPTFRNYIAVFHDGQFINGIINSTIVASTTTLLALCIGSFVAFAMGKL